MLQAMILWKDAHIMPLLLVLKCAKWGNVGVTFEKSSDTKGGKLLWGAGPPILPQLDSAVPRIITPWHHHYLLALHNLPSPYIDDPLVFNPQTVC